MGQTDTVPKYPKKWKKTWLGYCFIQAWGSLVLIRIQICPGVSIPWCPGGPKLAGFLPEETSMNEPKICLFTFYEIFLIHEHIHSHLRVVFIRIPDRNFGSTR